MPGPARFWHDGQLGVSGQRLLKALHVVFAGIWLGAIGAIAVLLWQGAGSLKAGGLLIAAFQIHEHLLNAAFIGTLATGLAFSLYTKWGFFTHDWISAKWALALLLFGLTLGLQTPALSAMAGLADAGLDSLDGHSLRDYRHRARLLASGQLGIVVAVYFISTIKPWGRRNPPAVSRRAQRWGILLPVALAAAFGLYNHLRLRQYRTMEIPDRTAAHLADGVRSGTAGCAVPYEVEVSVRNGRIAGVRATRTLDNHYAHIGEAVLPRIVREQRTRVDAITGATTTSTCLMAAAADALR